MKRDDFVPETLQQAITYFSDDEVCHDFMVSLRWPNNKVMCPHCQSENVKFFTSTPKKAGTPIRRLWQS